MTGDATGPGMPPSGPTSLAELLAGLAAGLPEARLTTGGERTAWSRGGVTFAVITGEAVELRLDPAVAAAALRTPDTSDSTRGRPWVRFAPRELDGHAIDRAAAWFGLAYRRAAGQ